MAAKRKRASSTASTPATSASLENGSRPDATSASKGKSRDVESGADHEHKGPRVNYIAAEGSSSWTKSLDLDRDYAKSLKHIAKKLGVPKVHSGKLRLAHVRDGGREVEIWDDIDYQAFKTRATASPGSSLTLKVYGASSASGSSTPSASANVKSNVGAEGKKSEAKGDVKASLGKGKKEKKQSNTPQTQAEGSRTSTPSTSAQPSSSKSKQRKQPSIPKSTSAYTLPQIGSASPGNTAPPSSPSVASTTADAEISKSQKGKDKKRKSSSDLSSAPSPASAPYTPSPAQAPSPFNAGRPIAALKFADKYKPARPSPLGPNRIAKASTPVAGNVLSPATTATPVESTEKRRKRNRRQKAALRASSESRSNTPQSTPQVAAVAKETGEDGNKDAEERKGSSDRSPPKKRSRKSLPKDHSPQSTPAPESTPTIPEVTMTSPPVEPSADTGGSSKKVLRISDEEFDLKQKPKESNRKSSSVTGKKKKADQSATIETPTALAEPAANTAAAASIPGPSTTSADNTVLIPESPPTVSKSLPTKRPVGRPKKTQAAADAPLETVPIAAPPTIDFASPSDATSTAHQQEAVSTTETPATPVTTKKGKGKATASKAKTTIPAVPVPAASSSPPPANEDTCFAPSSSPAPSSDPPTGTDSTKKKKPVKPKKRESTGPTPMDLILEKVNKRLAAAEAAAKAALGSGETTTGSPAGDVPPSPDMTATATEPVAVAQSSTQAAVEAVDLSQAGIEADTPVVSIAEIAPEAEAETDPTDKASVITETVSTVADEPTPPVVDPATSLQPPVDEPVPSVKPPATSTEPVLPSDEEEDALDCISPEYKRDVEMREATPNVEVAVPAVIASAASLTTDATAAVDTTMATTEAEEDLSTPTPEVSPVQQDIDATMSEFEAEIPQSQKATSTTSSTSKSRATKGRVSQVPCVICMRTPWHYQKDCPEVKAGADSLRYLLTARREQSESLDSEEDAAQLDQSIEAIQEWVERLENIAGKVQGVVKRNDFKPRSPVKVMGSEDGETVDLNADSMMKAEKSKADASIAISLPSAAPNSSKSPEVTTTQLPDKTASTSTQMVQPTPEIAPESPSTVPDTYNFPPIHLRAMRKGRRPGSTSALSVSDALIETEPSDDSSSDDDDDQSESDTGKDEDKDEGGSESDTSSVVSTTSVNSSDSDVSSNSGSATSRVAMPSNPSDAMRFSLTRDLSEREKKKARLSAAKMQPVTFDQESVIDDNGNDEQEEEQVTPPTPVTRGRAGSDSSIGDFGDDASRRSSIDSTTSAPYRSQAPPVVASSAQPIRSPSPSAASEHESIEDANASASTSAIADIETPTGGDEDVDEGTPSTVARPDDTDAESEAEAAPRDENAKSSGQMSRSFRDIDGTAASSPDLDDSAGLEAVQQGIADEEDGTTTSQAEETQDTMAPIPVATQSLSQARRTRRSSAVAQSQEAPVSASQPLRRSSRTSVPPQDLPSRLRRSVSREVVEKTPPPPSRASRSVSRSMASMSPSTPKARRASNNLPRVEELDVETPKQNTPRRTRSTRSRQPDQPESSFPLEQSSQSQSQPTAAIDRHTQPTPVRRSTRASPSPLFMTQGSQFPATQFYNPYPETLSASQTQTQNDSLSQGEPSSAQPSSSAPVRARSTRNAKVNGHSMSLATSPIIEEREREQEQDQEDQDMSFTSQSLPGDTQPSPSQVPTNSQMDVDGDVEMNDNDNESRASDEFDDERENDNDNDNEVEVEDDLASIPDIQPPKPRNLPPSSQASTTPIYPSLSSLPKEFLRKSWVGLFGNGNSDNGPTTPIASSRQAKAVHSTNGNGEESDDDSGSSSDSSVERAQAPPSVLKGRFASGGMERKKAASQPAGW